MPLREIDWTAVRRVLVIRLRSIGDTVLATPSLIALRRFLPNAKIDILLETWVAPLLDGFGEVDNVLATGPRTLDRLKTVLDLRRQDYDVVINLHGGTTATTLVAMSGAKHRIGFAGYQYSLLHNHAYPPAIDFWERESAHSAEQQLALLGYAGVPVKDQPKSRLEVTAKSVKSVTRRLPGEGHEFVLMHPAAAFAAKEWPVEGFARTAEMLARDHGLRTVAVASTPETAILSRLVRESRVPVSVFDDLSLPEITALAARVRLFVGNDSGIAHIAAAVGTPVVVIFGPSNREHWFPWTNAPSRMVYNELTGRTCPSGICSGPDQDTCIHNIEADKVFAAINDLLPLSNPDHVPEY